MLEENWGVIRPVGGKSLYWRQDGSYKLGSWPAVCEILEEGALCTLHYVSLCSRVGRGVGGGKGQSPPQKQLSQPPVHPAWHIHIQVQQAWHTDPLQGNVPPFPPRGHLSTGVLQDWVMPGMPNNMPPSLAHYNLHWAQGQRSPAREGLLFVKHLLCTGQYMISGTTQWATFLPILQMRKLMLWEVRKQQPRSPRIQSREKGWGWPQGEAHSIMMDRKAYYLV